MIKAIAIDDEAPALKVIGNLCGHTAGIRLEKTFIRPGEALRYLRQFPVDLLFLDINMPSLSGIELYRELAPDTMAIFTTAHSEYAVEGFNLNAVDYLLKPFTLQRFQQAVAKASELLALRNSGSHSTGSIVIKADYSLIKVPTDEILFVEAADDYLKIHLENKPPMLTRMTMKSLSEMLPTSGFVRSHRSYIVAIRRIEQVRKGIIYLSGREIPIGSNYEEAFYRAFGR